MNTVDTSRNPMDRENLDRLVDGELSEEERRQLLKSFDGKPDGWRRCALAFLEAQSWQRELSDLLAESSHPAAVSPSKTTFAARRPRGSSRSLAKRSATVLAMAASFLGALWLGWIAQDSRQTARVAVPEPGTLAQSGGQLETADPIQPLGPDAQQRAVAPSGPWQMVTLSADPPDGQRSRTIELPACERHGLDSQWPGSLPPALPRDVLESLERAGYQVKQHRELMPIEMHDGRRLVVPVEQVEVQYVGRPPL